MIAGKSADNQGLDLRGTRVLLIEDEYYIADDVRRTLNSAGAEVVGPFSSVPKAQDALLAGGFDCAIVDLNLNGESAVPLAEQLMWMDVPFAIATGYGSAAVPEQLAPARRIEKPFDASVVLNLVRRWAARGV